MFNRKLCIWQHLANFMMTHKLVLLLPSLMPRPHPAHARRRDLVSQVQILGLTSQAWSAQSNRRAAFIGIMRKQEQVLQWYRSKRVMRFIIQLWPICNYEASTLPQAQGFSLVTPDPFLVRGLGLGTRLAPSCLPRVTMCAEVWPSLITNQHRGAYLQVSLSFLPSCGKHT